MLIDICVKLGNVNVTNMVDLIAAYFGSASWQSSGRCRERYTSTVLRHDLLLVFLVLSLSLSGPATVASFGECGACLGWAKLSNN